MKQILDKLSLPPEKRKVFERMPAPVRTWALARAAWESVKERCDAEQDKVKQRVQTTDPEPQWEPGIAQEDWRGHWTAWLERNKPAWDECDAIAAKHRIEQFRKLMVAAEQEMVVWAKRKIHQQYPARFKNVAPAFEQYEAGRLRGSLLKRFLTICSQWPT